MFHTVLKILVLFNQDSGYILSMSFLVNETKKSGSYFTKKMFKIDYDFISVVNLTIRMLLLTRISWLLEIS